MTHIYRNRALQARGRRALGSVILITPLRHKFWAVGAALVTFMLMVFVVSASYTRKETVSGYLTTDKGVIRVFPPRSGVISEIKVVEGAWVERGDVLAVVMNEAWTADAMGVQQAVRRELEDERADVAQQIEAENEMLLTGSSALKAEQTFQERQRQIISQQLVDARQRLRIVKSQAEHAKALAGRGYLSRRDLQRLELTVLESRMAAAELEQALNGANVRATQIALELERLPAELTIKLGHLQSRHRRLNQEILRENFSRGFAVRAPVDGRITGVTSSAGQQTAVDQVLASIVPSEARFVARLLVPTRSAGFVEPGQSVRIRLDAYPYQKYGMQPAKLIEISRTIVSPSDIPVTARIAEPAYLVTAALSSQVVQTGNREFLLRPEMSLRADIIRDRRRVVEWILEPLLSVRLRS